MKTRALAPVLAVAGGLVMTAMSTPAAAQSSGTFTLTQNGNEIATEEYTRTDDRLETQLEVTGQALITTTAALADDASVDRLELRILPPATPDADPLQSIAAEFGSDSVHVEMPIGTAAGAGPATAGTVPYVDPSPSYMEQILRRARALGGAEATVQVWVPSQGAGQVIPAQVAFGDDDSTATLSIGTVTFQFDLDDEGGITRGEVPAQGLVIEQQ